MVARLLGLPAPPSPDHAADALAVAICEVNRGPLADALARSLPPHAPDRMEAPA
jgi:crossover junction endodeoxyribonuclease RuvC